MGKKEKDKEQNSDGATGEGADAACNACYANWNLSRERATALDKLVAEAIARETAGITATFTAILNERTTVNLPETLKVTSGVGGFKALAPFDSTRDKAIYH